MQFIIPFINQRYEIFRIDINDVDIILSKFIFILTNYDDNNV